MQRRIERDRGRVQLELHAPIDEAGRGLRGEREVRVADLEDVFLHGDESVGCLRPTLPDRQGMDKAKPRGRAGRWAGFYNRSL